MKQPIRFDPPWWDGNISIPFSRDQWYGILIELSMLYSLQGFPEDDYDNMIVSIIDEIKKCLEDLDKEIL